MTTTIHYNKRQNVKRPYDKEKTKIKWDGSVCKFSNERIAKCDQRIIYLLINKQEVPVLDSAMVDYFRKNSLSMPEIDRKKAFDIEKWSIETIREIAKKPLDRKAENKLTAIIIMTQMLGVKRSILSAIIK